MSLYIVVRHRGDKPHPNWTGNVWVNDACIRSIITTPTVARQCASAGADMVYFHRTGWVAAKVPPLICCSARVEQIVGSSAKPTVVFKDVNIVGLPPKRRLFGPTNSYYEEPPS
jgi:hypothetical protein